MSLRVENKNVARIKCREGSIHENVARTKCRENLFIRNFRNI